MRRHGEFDPGVLFKFVLPVAAAIALGVGLFSSFAEIEPGEVAAVYNTTGSTAFGEDCKVIQHQGTTTVVPVFQRFEKLSIEPQILVLEGQIEAMNQSRRLDVRAKDGSSFWFDRIEVHYQAVGTAVCAIIAAYGPGDNYKETAVVTDVRNVLRDEFGRFSFEEVADPSKYGAAIAASKTELNARLNPYGIQVTQIVTQKPRFQPEVEKAIEDRQTATQEIEVQTEKRTRLVAHKDRAVQDVRQGKNAELQTLQATLAGQRKEADNASAGTHREADKYYINTTTSCQGVRDAAKVRAAANEEASRKVAEGLKAKIDALGNQGPGVLDIVIAQHVIPQLVTLKGSPFSKPATTSQIDVRQVPGVVTRTPTNP